MRPALRKRFYERAGVGAETEGAHPVLLDERPVRTPVRRTLAAPTRALAQAISDEWQAQSDVIDPARMPLTRLANTIIDGVMAAPDAVADEIEKYLGSDLLCYRAERPEGLVALQERHWNPILDWSRNELDASFAVAAGVTFMAQSRDAIAAAARAIPRDAWRLGAVHTVTTLTGSALLALALGRGATDVDAAWAAAHVDEDWNMAQWGRDELALARREFRFNEMRAAAQVLALTS
jgi:chaperone required for assembly of F1-ATPase